MHTYYAYGPAPYSEAPDVAPSYPLLFTHFIRRRKYACLDAGFRTWYRKRLKNLESANANLKQRDTDHLNRLRQQLDTAQGTEIREPWKKLS